MAKTAIKDEMTDYDYLDREEAEYQGYDAEDDYDGYMMVKYDRPEGQSMEFDELDSEESEENDREDEKQSDDENSEEEEPDSYTIDGVV